MIFPGIRFMKGILNYADLVTLEELLTDRLARVRRCAAEHGHQVDGLIQQWEGTLERLGRAIEALGDED
jgi:hypothetical protein